MLNHWVINNFLKTHCPRCKEIIYSNARICPKCNFDFHNWWYNRNFSWQKKIKKYWLYFNLIFFIVLSLNSNLLIAFIVFVFLYLGGLFLLVKSIKMFNFFN